MNSSKAPKLKSKSKSLLDKLDSHFMKAKKSKEKGGVSGPITKETGTDAVPPTTKNMGSLEKNSENNKNGSDDLPREPLQISAPDATLSSEKKQATKPSYAVGSKDASNRRIPLALQRPEYSSLKAMDGKELISDIISRGPNGKELASILDDKYKNKEISRKKGRMQCKKNHRIVQRGKSGIKGEWLNSRERRDLGMMDEGSMNPSICRYEDYASLHDAWLEYYRRVTANSKSVTDSVKQMEKEGSYVEVIRSAQPEDVGQSGIVLYETMHTFRIVTKHNTIKTILKKGRVFKIHTNNCFILLYGDYLCDKSSLLVNSKS